MGKHYEKVELVLGSTIDEAVELLQRYRSQGIDVSVNFNGITLYSDTVTLDNTYIQIIGMTKAQID